MRYIYTITELLASGVQLQGDLHCGQAYLQHSRRRDDMNSSTSELGWNNFQSLDLLPFFPFRVIAISLHLSLDIPHA